MKVCVYVCVCGLTVTMSEVGVISVIPSSLLLSQLSAAFSVYFHWRKMISSFAIQTWTNTNKDMKHLVVVLQLCYV